MATPARLAGVGAFVLGGLLLFAIALFMIGDRQMAFATKLVIYTEFTRITGLQPGAIVRVSGARAGSVSEIQPPADPSGKFRVRIEVTEDLQQLVRTDSVASIETEGLIGGSFLSISTGSAAAPQAPSESTIPSREPFLVADLIHQMSDTIQQVNATIDDLRVGIERTLLSADATIDNANELIDAISGDVKTMTSAGARISADAAAIAAQIRKGEGTIGRLVNDDELYQRATGIARTAEEISVDARRLVQQARQAIERFESDDGQVATVTGNLKNTLENANAAMTGLAENMEALKRTFFFRGFFNRRGYFNLSDISPDEYRKGALTAEGDRQVERVWLRGDVLFEATPRRGSNDAAERLSDAGMEQVNKAVTPFLPRLIDGVLMVEGYWHEGSTAEQYLVSRRRAALVRDYLLAKFQANPRSVGLMPLGADPVGRPPQSPWSGVALAFFIDE